MALQQIRIDEKGTFGGYDPETQQGFAASDVANFQKFFPGQQPNPTAGLATFDTSKILSQPNQLIPVSSIVPQPPLVIPQPQQGVDNAGAVVAGAKEATKSIEQYIKELIPPETETEKKYKNIIGELEGLIPEQAGRGAALAAKEMELGVPEKRKMLADLNAQILSKSAQYDYTVQSIEGKPIPMDFIIGQQAQVRKMQASEIGLLQARALGMQGQLEAAQETANRAIDLQYEVVEDKIKIKLQQLELVKPLLDKEETRFAEARRRKLEDEMRAIEEQKASQKTNLGIVLESGVAKRFMNRSGEFVRASDGKAYSTPEEFFKDAGVTSFQEAYAKGLVEDYGASGSSNSELNKLLTPTEAARLRVPYGTTRGQAAEMNKTPAATLRTTTPKPPPGPPKPGIPPSPKNPFLGKAITANSVRQRAVALKNYAAASGQDPLEAWGQTADEIRAAGGNPSNYDETLWDVFRPGEFSKFNKKSDRSAK